MFLSPLCRAAASATVRTVKRKRMLPTRAALTLVQKIMMLFGDLEKFGEKIFEVLFSA
jgi:hypothetical protein